MRLFALTTVSPLITTPAMAAAQPLQATTIPSFGAMLMFLTIAGLALGAIWALCNYRHPPKSANTAVPPHLRDDVDAY